MEIKNPITLNELAKQFNLSKSTLHYYLSFGLIRSTGIVGNAYLLDKVVATRTIKEIQRLKKSGLSLMEIKKKI